MQVHQIVIRPAENFVIVLFHDLAGGRQSLTFDSSGEASVAGVVSLCQGKLPSAANHPAKAEIQREIAELESRVSQLKTAIGAA